MGLEWGDDTLETEPRKGEKPHLHHMLDQLTAERDNLRKQISEIAKALNHEIPYQASLVKRIETLKRQRDGLEAERTQLKAVLKPFAEIANHYSEDEDDTHQLFHDAHEPGVRVTLGMCRAARR